MSRALIALAAGAVAASAATVLAGLYVASRVVGPPRSRKRDIRLFGTALVGESLCLVLERSERTSKPGTYSVWFDGGHAQVGDVLAESRTTVMREINRIDEGDIANASSGSWSGYVYTSAAALGLQAEEVEISTQAGIAPAWRINPTEPPIASTWALHIHGLGSSRAGTLRGVKAAAASGLISLVVSYRNDGEGPNTRGRLSTLGMDETEDVARAFDYAISEGATRVVIFGWSMGASIALSLMTRHPYANRIAAVVAISPVVDWNQTIQANCQRAGLPAVVGVIASTILESPAGARALRLPRALPLGEFNWLARSGEINRPLLLLHGAQDWSAPISASQTLSAKLQPNGSLFEFDSGHTMEWNADPEGWDELVRRWVSVHVLAG
jgi:pimeloyl-ACP methyl ester carboxylesterase